MCGGCVGTIDFRLAFRVVFSPLSSAGSLPFEALAVNHTTKTHVSLHEEYEDCRRNDMKKPEQEAPLLDVARGFTTRSSSSTSSSSSSSPLSWS
jgi:hypothetical protein